MRRADAVLMAIPGIVLSGLFLERAIRAFASAGTGPTVETLSSTVPFSIVGMVLAGCLILNEIVRAPALES